MRSCLHNLRIGASLLCNLVHNVDERVESLYAFVLRRLYHHCLVEEQREVDGRSMVAIVEQTLCHVHCGNAGALVLQTVKHKLVLADCRDWQFIVIAERLLDVVGCESGKRTDHAYVLTSQCKDVAVSTHHHSEVAEELANMDVAVVRCYDVVCTVCLLCHLGNGEQILQTFAYADRTRTGTAATVRCRECLVQVDVHNVESHISRTASAEHRVEVSSIIIHQTAALVNEALNLRNLTLEETKSVGVGHHHSCDGVVKQTTEVINVHYAIGC